MAPNFTQRDTLSVDRLNQRNHLDCQRFPREFEAQEECEIVRRKLSDGQEFQVVKVFHEPKMLEATLRQAAWEGSARSTGRFFLYGSFRAWTDGSHGSD
jgi:hypothetical protein